MWFKQYMLEEQGAIYILWLAESGEYYQDTLTPNLECEQHVKLSSK